MANKTFRTIYLNRELDARLVKHAEQEHSSVSRLVRIALERHLNANPASGKEHTVIIGNPGKAMEA